MPDPEETEMKALSEVADYMARDIKSVPADAKVQDAGRMMAKFNVGSLLVVNNGQYVGILTDTDLARKAMVKGLNPEIATVESLMSHPIISIESYKTVEEAQALMKAKGVRHLTVTEDGKIVGVLTLSDVVRYYATYFQMSE